VIREQEDMNEAADTDAHGSAVLDREPQAANVVVRAYANPLPLGFFAFGVGMALLACLALDVITGSEEVRATGVLLAAFVCPLEILAAVIAFLVRDTGAASALGLFSTSWAALGVLYILAPDQQTSRTVGVYLCAFALMLVPLAAIAFLGKRLLGLVLSVSIARGALAAAYQLGAPHALQTADAVAALLLVGLALYSGTAFLIEDVRQRTKLPIMRRGDARGAIEDDLLAQQARLPREPGVRRQL
jgi:succinate-acetate transporter protein